MSIMKHFNITFRPDGRQITIHAGATLVEAAGQAGIVLNTACGEKGTCGKCAVNIEPAGRSVLACQYHIQSDLTVTIPPESRLFEHKILKHGIDVLKKIQPLGRLEHADAKEKIFGLAVDIGTTTVVAKLIDMTTGQCAATEAAVNPQVRYGDDVISRIAYAQTDEKLLELHKVIIDCINKLTAKLCDTAAIAAKQILQMCVVGNTTMNHIFLKLPIKQLGQAPYRAFSVDAKDVSSNDLSLQINPTGKVHTVENIAGFVGSDTTAVALAVDVDSAEEMTLVVDIGTNGEIVLGTKNKLYAASCAAGPALEGARITYGSRAVEGAIEAVVANEEGITVDVIGNCPPRSICGSGLIDAVAVLLNLGVIDSSGRLLEPQMLEIRLPRAILSRMVEHDDQPAFVIAYSSNDSKPVVLTQRDIRQMQLAKAAIRAGIRLLQKKFNIDDSGIKHIFLAGAFGNYIRPESALRTGLLPNVPIERIHFVGNAASSGAQMILLSSYYRSLSKKLARKIEYIEIANEKDFASVFADCMLF